MFKLTHPSSNTAVSCTSERRNRSNHGSTYTHANHRRNPTVRFLSTLAFALPGLWLCQGVHAAPSWWGSSSWGFGSDQVVGTCEGLESNSGTTDITGNVYTTNKDVTCDFTVPETAEPVLCNVELTYVLPEAPACVKQGKYYVLDIYAACNTRDLAVTGTLECPTISLIDNLGLYGQNGNPITRQICRRAFGSADAPVLSHQIKYTDSNCTQLVVDTTPTTMQACHADNPLGEGDPNCKDGSDYQTVNGTAENDTNVACRFNDPWNVSCGGNKDNGVVTGIFLGRPPADNTNTLLLPIDVNAIDYQGAEPEVYLNDVRAERCTVKDIDSDGVEDLDCKFLSCNNGQFIAPNGNASMKALRTGSGSVVQCSDEVKIIQ